MKNALITGIVIGILSCAWLFAMHLLGYNMAKDQVSPYEYFSIIIPVVCLYIGIRNYRENDCNKHMGFLEALMQSFKILMLGGAIAMFGAVLYISYIDEGNNLRNFSGRMFGALLIGILSAFSVSLLLYNKTNKVD